ncbi:hypothetical protein ACWDE9_36280 [Streptomyces olivaceoviridis]
MTGTENAQTSAFAPVAAVPAAATRPAHATRPTSTSRRPGAKKAAPAGGADPRFENGPLAVVDVDADGEVLAYCTGGLVLDTPAKAIPALVEWTFTEARLGQPHTPAVDVDLYAQALALTDRARRPGASHEKTSTAE